MSGTLESPNPYSLQCMDLWSGNQSASSEVATPGMELLVYSQPYHGESKGGDVHYVSLCASGYITRIVLADVSGHGELVAGTSQQLRALVRRFMNTTSQTRLVREINREFTRENQSSRFATAIVATYLSSDKRLVLCNAGHPRPLWFQRRTGRWTVVTQELAGTGRLSNLPLGLDDSMTYQQFGLTVEEGDIFLFYTDALTEAHGQGSQLLGEDGLLSMIQDLPTDQLKGLTQGILSGLNSFSGGQPADDDLTILLLRYTGKRRWQTLSEKLNAYAKFLRLKRV